MGLAVVASVMAGCAQQASPGAPPPEAGSTASPATHRAGPGEGARPAWSTGARVGRPGDLGLTSVSCPTTSFCLAVGAGGRAYRYDGGRWEAAPAVGAADAPSAVSCAGVTLCVAVDHLGFTYQFDGTRWTRGQNLGSPLTSVTCPYQPFSTSCTAVDLTGHSYDTNGVTSRSSGPPDTSAWTAVSCTEEVEVCELGGEHGHIGGRFGSTAATGVTLGRGTVTFLSCPGSTFCLAASDDGEVYGYSYFTTLWHGVRLVPTGAGGLTSVSCPTSSLGPTAYCVAVARNGTAFTYRDGHWSPGHRLGVRGKADLTSVSCPSDTTGPTMVCVAVSRQGEAYTYTYRSTA